MKLQELIDQLTELENELVDKIGRGAVRDMEVTVSRRGSGFHHDIHSIVMEDDKVVINVELE